MFLLRVAVLRPPYPRRGRPRPAPGLRASEPRADRNQCDEKRPSCANCTITDRSCTYPSQAASTGARTPTPSTPPPAHLTIPTLIPPFATHAADTEPPVNAAHVDLALHFSLVVVVPDIDADMCAPGTKIALDAALAAPYLLHELLAFSARHLAVEKPDASAEHLARAVRLQNMAIAQFNAAKAEVDSSNCVPMLLFSSLLGRHLLIDTLAARSDLGSFLDRYVQYVGIHRGLRAVASSSWPLLIRSELKPLLSWGSGAVNSAPRGEQCAQLRQLIAASALSPVEADACHKAVYYLQIGFDELADSKAGGKLQCQIAFMWSIVVPVEFTEMVGARRAEAMAILAYYAVLLHHRRGMWQFGEAGMYLFDLVVRWLGADWGPWMAWPRTLLSS